MPQETPAQRGRRACAVQAFCRRQNPGAGRIHSARACESPGSPRDGTSCGACGITFEKFQDIKQGDVIEAFLMEQIEV